MGFLDRMQQQAEKMNDELHRQPRHAVRHVSGVMLNARYFAGRADGLRMSGGEDLLVATT